MTEDEQIELLDMAMKESGWREWVDINLEDLGNGRMPTFTWSMHNGENEQPLRAAMWVAMSLLRQKLGLPLACWICCYTDEALDCYEGRCTHPEGPTRPPRELLRPPSVDSLPPVKAAWL